MPISQTAGLVFHGEDDQIVLISMSKAGSLSTDAFLLSDPMALVFALAMAAISFDFQEL
ncbi:hypothetical protein [Rhizobium leguminosarum]|uniref:hypothetical protein n=1 Tax=Rhizobium leguminosarum TaxID=384 RepID=UPI001C948E1C|nr:hypothetical protein [Rhizobium leguminosarum]MBY5347141.1 hypothetical protein [Rhizobium leguminosarum]